MAWTTILPELIDSIATRVDAATCPAGYLKDKVLWHDGDLYQCQEDITAETAWIDATKLKPVVLADLFNKSSSEEIQVAQNWNDTKSYEIDEIVQKDHKLWICGVEYSTIGTFTEMSSSGMAGYPKTNIDSATVRGYDVAADTEYVDKRFYIYSTDKIAGEFSGADIAKCDFDIIFYRDITLGYGTETIPAPATIRMIWHPEYNCWLDSAYGGEYNYHISIYASKATPTKYYLVPYNIGYVGPSGDIFDFEIPPIEPEGEWIQTSVDTMYKNFRNYRKAIDAAFGTITVLQRKLDEVEHIISLNRT